MDLQARIDDIRRRIAEIRARLEDSDSIPVSFCSESFKIESDVPSVVVPSPTAKPKSDLDDIKAKLNKMKK